MCMVVRYWVSAMGAALLARRVYWHQTRARGRTASVMGALAADRDIKQLASGVSQQDLIMSKSTSLHATGRECRFPAETYLYM